MLTSIFFFGLLPAFLLACIKLAFPEFSEILETESEQIIRGLIRGEISQEDLNQKYFPPWREKAQEFFVGLGGVFGHRNQLILLIPSVAGWFFYTDDLPLAIGLSLGHIFLGLFLLGLFAYVMWRALIWLPVFSFEFEKPSSDGESHLLNTQNRELTLTLSNTQRISFLLNVVVRQLLAIFGFILSFALTGLVLWFLIDIQWLVPFGPGEPAADWIKGLSAVFSFLFFCAVCYCLMWSFPHRIIDGYLNPYLDHKLAILKGKVASAERGDEKNFLRL